jgi:hypothetical protein
MTRWISALDRFGLFSAGDLGEAPRPYAPFL